MTEQKNTSAMVEETTPAVESAPLPEQPPQKNRSGIAGIALHQNQHNQQDGYH